MCELFPAESAFQQLNHQRYNDELENLKNNESGKFKDNEAGKCKNDWAGK